MEEIKAQILEWDSYLPQVKKQSIDVLVDNIIDLAVSKERERIVEGLNKLQKYTGGSSVEPKDIRVKVIDIINLIDNKA